MTARPVALVTGASSGIGAEFARQLAASGHDLVLIARDADRLGVAAVRLRESFGADVEILPADLLTADGLARAEGRARDQARPVTMLVNNAGYGLTRPFDENSVEQEDEHLAIHARVTMRLTHAALQSMLPRGSGTVVNIASVAGFAPRGSYGAAKAWMLSFSRWANWYYAKRGITVTAVAPGFVRTEFHARMNVRDDAIPAVLWLEAEQVVRLALRDVRRGKAISVPTLRYKVLVMLAKVLPTGIVAAGTLRAR